VGFKASLDTEARGKILCLCLELNLGRPGLFQFLLVKSKQNKTKQNNHIKIILLYNYTYYILHYYIYIIQLYQNITSNKYQKCFVFTYLADMRQRTLFHSHVRNFGMNISQDAAMIRCTAGCQRKKLHAGARAFN
jgi:hypothetical protein